MVSPVQTNVVLDGDRNYYAVDPFKNPFCKSCKKEPQPVGTKEEKQEIQYIGQLLDDIGTADTLGNVRNSMSGHEFDGPEPPALPYLSEVFGDNVTVYDDHVLFNNTLAVMRTRYFQDRLQDIETFDGFMPRWILPRSTI